MNSIMPGRPSWTCPTPATRPVAENGHAGRGLLRVLRAALLLCVLSAPLAAGAAGGNAGGEKSALRYQEVELAIAKGVDRAPPFNRPRMLRVPAGFQAELVARVPGARFLALAPGGELLVSTPGSDAIMLLKDSGSGAMRSSVFADKLRNPHDMVFHTLQGQTWLYVAESHRIIRARWSDGDTRMQKPEVVVDNLPDSSSAELKGSYGHQLKNIALHGDKLYVSIASTCNACASDTVSDPVRSAIYEHPASGGRGRLFARGIRNAEGLAFRPGSSELWIVVNNRDNIAYPFRKDFDGDGSDDYGKVIPAYVDGHPPELLIKVREGANYGWPFCNSNPDQGMDNMPYDRDVQHNADGKRLDCSTLERPTKGLTPHSAPLGMSFLPVEGMPPALQGAIAVALHGCWNCTSLNGHKLVMLQVGKDGKVGEETDLVSGWLSDPKQRQRWGRPVDVIPDAKGGLFISDDYAGAVYRLRPAR